MRKFRIWDSIDKKVILPEQEENRPESDQPTLLAIGLHGLPIALDSDSFRLSEIIGWNVNHNRIVMQSTGLTDANGSEVYEGDILANEDDMVVVFWLDESGGFMKRPLNDNTLNCVTSLRSLRYWRVIGNIYENPELIN